jgi:hypothetical protein
MKTNHLSALLFVTCVFAATAAIAKSEAPVVYLKAMVTSVAYNGSSGLIWASTNAQSCSSNNNWSGGNATSGKTSLNNLTQTQTYSLTCTGEGGTASTSLNITVAPPPVPSVSLTATPASVSYNGKAVLNWTTANVTSCTASGGWTGAMATAGSYTTPALTTATTYTLTCSNALGSTASQSTTVSVASNSGLTGNSLGINLSEVNDWDDHQLTFIDVMKQSRGFANISNPWDPTTNPVPLDANGWPTTDFGVYFITTVYDPLNRPLTTTYPSLFGTYTLSFNGQATIGSQGGNQILNQVYNASSNTTTAQVVVSSANSQLDLEFTNTIGGVQNLQLLRPGYTLGTPQVFTNQLLQAVTPFGVLRVMELLQTNANPVTTWAGRKLPTDPTQQDPRGVAWEYVIQLANAANKDIWINIPQGVNLADTTTNNYVTQLATLLKANLNPNLHVYVEFSNELWNTAFSQSNANTNAAVAAVNTGTDTTLNYDNINNQWYWGYRLTAHNIVQISQLFANVYGAAAINTTIRPVYVSQEVQPFLTEDSLSYIQNNFGNPAQFIYGIGGAPYFAAGNADTTLNSLFSSLVTGLDQYLPGFTGLPAYTGGVVYSGETFLSLANYYGLKRITYEGGPDLSAESSTALTEQAAADTRINQMVQGQLSNYFGCGNSLFVYYKLAAPAGTAFGAYEDITVTTQKSAALATVAATPLSSYTSCSAAY